MFNWNNFVAVRNRDNSHYERILRSKLHNLVALLQQHGANATIHALDTEIRGITRNKWRKYTNTKSYLLRQFLGLAAQVRDYLGEIAGFHSVAMHPGAGGFINHTVGWNSSTGNLADLQHVITRERVDWAVPMMAAMPYVLAEYSIAGFHTGMATTPATTGRNRDTHHPVGPFLTPATLNYNSPNILVYNMNQTYQYSDDGGTTWNNIAGSGYTIVRQLQYVNARPRCTITKTSNVLPALTFTNHLDI